MKKNPDAKPGDPLLPMGDVSSVRRALADFNTAPDGAPPKPNAMTEILYGPGMIVEIPLNQEEVVQCMVSINDVDTALPVLLRLSKQLKWMMLDIESGRSYG
jgi:hypothetical protein